MNSSATTTMTFVNSKSLPFLFFLLLVLLSCILVSTAVDVVKDNDSSSSSSNGLELGQGGGEVEEDEVVDDSSPPAVDYSGYQLVRVTVHDREDLVTIAKFTKGTSDSLVEVWHAPAMHHTDSTRLARPAASATKNAQAEEDSAFVDLFIHPSVATGLSEFLQTHHLEKRVLVHDFADVLSTSHQKQPQRQWPRRQVQLRRIIQTQPQQQLTPLGKQRLKAIQQYREILSGRQQRPQPSELLLLSQIVGGSPFAEEKASPEKTEEVEILESESESDEKKVGKFDLGSYHPYREIAAHLHDLAARNPGLVKVGSLGKSYEQRELLYVKIGLDLRTDKSRPKEAMWIDAGIHAREWIAPAVALNTIDKLLTDPKYTQVLQKIDVYILPSLNPDGYEYSRKGDRMWRRTRSRRPQVTNCVGVDANRNFPYHYNETGTTGYCSQVYSGPGPLSELETQLLAEFLLDHNSTLKAYLTLHAYGNLIMYPFSHRVRTYPPDVETLANVGNKMAKAIAEAGGPSFTVGTGADILYEAAGTSESFAKSVGIKYCYTMELTSGWPSGFVYPEEQVAEFSAQVIPGILTLAEQVAEEAAPI